MEHDFMIHGLKAYSNGSIATTQSTKKGVGGYWRHESLVNGVFGDFDLNIR
jgi:hypothetical protein